MMTNNVGQRELTSLRVYDRSTQRKC